MSHRRFAAMALIGLVAGVGVVGSGGALGASGPVVKSAPYRTHSIVVDTKGISLYLLSTEANDKVTCTGVCTVFWPPLTVPSGTKSVTAGKGVLGTLGLVKRSDGTLQVTYNGYPAYYYLQDSKAGQTSGEGISSFGGTWYLLNASATTGPTTAVH